MQHVARVKNMAQQLRDIGEPVMNTTVIAKILASLASKYNAFQTVWDNVEEHRQTIENLTERLIREEARLAGGSDATEALAAVKGGGAKSKSQSTPKNKFSKKDVECCKCKEKGHFARECPLKEKKSHKDKRDGSGSRNCAFVVINDGDACCTDNGMSAEQVHQFLAVGKEDAWLTDSGASQHISYRREWFDDFRPSQGGTVVLGNDGECKVEGVGTIHVEKFVNGRWSKGRIEGVFYVPSIRKNLFSVGACTEKGYIVQFDINQVTISRDKQLMAVGAKQTNAIYRMFFRVIQPQVASEVNISETDLRCGMKDSDTLVVAHCVTWCGTVLLTV